MLEIARRRMPGAGRVAFAAGLLATCLASAASAEPLAPDRVPEPLRPWVDWVLHAEPTARCPVANGEDESRICAWPARLELALGARRGSFEQRWRVHADSWVPLPGDAKHWPQAVQVDGRPAPVIPRSGRPSVRLAAGLHDVRGEFEWDAPPELLEIPPETGLLAVSQGGERIAFPRRDREGRLWLRSAPVAESSEESRLEIEVFRRIDDDVPLRITTRIRLEVSGPARELVLGRALPDGAVAMSLVATTPARLDPDGRLRVQVRPGTWNVTLEARMPGPVDALARPEPGGPWDEREEWVFSAQPSLRLVTVEGAASIDPQQTDLPHEWRALPAWAIEPGAGLRFVTKRRGDTDPAPDRLSLERNWWLDFDGGGYTVSDRIHGAIVRSDRLAMAPGTQLGRAAVNGVDQFITRLPGAPGDGIEIPRGEIEITADSRVPEPGSRLSAVGWDADFQSVAATLQLPPGWRLLHATGVDEVSASWVSRWSLLDLFVVLVVAMAFLRLFGPAWGALALAGLTLGYTELAAPRWIWIAVLAGEALRRAVVRGRLATLVRGAWQLALLALVLIALPFALAQLRGGLFPALDVPPAEHARQLLGQFQLDEMAAMESGQAMPEPAQQETLERREVPAAKAMRALDSAARSRADRADAYAPGSPAASPPRWAPDPKARITTGPGLPTWTWQTVRLAWLGPVERDQSLRLLLAPPWLNGVLAVLRVLLLAALVLRVLEPVFPRAGFPFTRAAGAAAALAALLVVAPAPRARADFPSEPLLEQLRARLLEAPACRPDCAASPRLRVEAEPGALLLRLQIDAAAPTAVPLPGGASDWVPDQVTVDGAPVTALRRGSDGALWLQLESGSHQVLIAGPLPDRDAIELPLPLKPHRVDASVRGWTLHGVGPDGVPAENLRLARVREANTQAGPALEPSALVPFASVTRTLRLGIRWQIETRIVRLTPSDATLALALPLLPGESVTTADVRSQDGKAFVSLGPGVSQVAFRSALDPVASLELRAPEATNWMETWVVDASPIWHVESEGIPPVHQEAAGVRLREWRPWPGETLTLRATRPEGVEGPTLTIDASRLDVAPGLRANDATLALQLRSSLGGQHAIRLPEAAELVRVTLDGVEQPIRQEGRDVTLPLAPGTRAVELAWREPRGISLRFEAPEVDLGAASVNAASTLSLSEDRWVLWVDGPRLGPSVLFWPLLLLIAAVAVGLGRLRNTPLRAHHWLLLGLGLTQVPFGAGALVAGWLLALGWRGAHGTALPRRWFDLVQVALALWTFAALAVLLYSIQQGLLGTPEMQVAGHQSTASQLRWYQDRADASLPRASVISIPLLAYRGAMLAWALWLATALIRWLRWGWAQFSQGELWRGRRRITPAA